jgi:hypothetical protein
MKHFDLRWLAPLVLVGSTFGQTVLYEEDFDAGLGAWVTSPVNSLWHWVPDDDACALLASPSDVGGGKVYMGTSLCDFDNPLASLEDLTLTQAINLPVGAVNSFFKYRSYLNSEQCNGWDFHWIMVSTDGGTSWEYVEGDCGPVLQWHEKAVNLDAYAGQSILLRLQFNPVDNVANDMFGWMIDDVQVVVDDCVAYNYCVAYPNSAAQDGARIGYQGTGNIPANHFALTLSDGPPSQFAHFFYGTGEVTFPLAQGALCVSTDGNGYRRLYPAMLIDPTGSLLRPLDFPSLQNQYAITAGSTWKFQCWYRDSVGGQSVSNFSDGLSMTFCQ